LLGILDVELHLLVWPHSRGERSCHP
jgi:hypothetical protein